MIYGKTPMGVLPSIIRAFCQHFFSIIGLHFYKQVKKAEISEYEYILILITIDDEKLYKNTIKKGKQSVKL